MRTVRLIVASYALTGVMFWYAVEKLFLKALEFSTLQISLIAVTYILIAAVTNVPTGIISDKYGRKPVLLGAAVFLLASTVLAGMADQKVVYALAAIMWGLFYATSHGAYEAILYDALQAIGKRKEYIRYNGYLMSVFWVMVALSSFAGAWIGDRYGLRAAYVVTIVPNIMNIVVLLMVREPAHEQAEKHVPAREMIRQSVRVLTSASSIAYLAVVYLILGAGAWLLNEFPGLYFIELGYAVLGVGILNGLISVAQAGGSLFGKRLPAFSTRIWIAALTGLYALTFMIPTTFRGVAVASLLALLFLRACAHVVVDAQLQHQLPSSIRNTVLSALGIMNDGLVVVAYLLFGMVSQYTNVRGSYLAVGVYMLLCGAAAGLYIRSRHFRSRSQYRSDDSVLSQIDAIPR